MFQKIFQLMIWKGLDYTDVYKFLVDYDSTDIDDILHIHKYLWKKDDIKCLDVLKNVYWIINGLHSRLFDR